MLLWMDGLDGIAMGFDAMWRVFVSGGCLCAEL